VVALMTQALLEPAAGAQPLRKVLEVGTGCGYQTAVLSPLVRQIFSIERIGALLTSTRARLKALGVDNIRFRHGDGFEGWPGQAPFDGIIVAAAPADVPAALLEQLAPGGRLVIPVGPPGGHDGGVQREVLERVSFVPFLEGTD
jgi:protein-L-isoaspartate(D-aspartate) O-methyltransferase